MEKKDYKVIFLAKGFSDKTTFGYRDNKFKAVSDSTDHAEFICEACETTAKILEVVAMDINKDNNLARLNFQLTCPKCKINGFRKMYLKEK